MQELSELSVPEIAAKEGGPPSFHGVFIRAPAILEVGPEVEVLAEVTVASDKRVESQEGISESEKRVIVAVKQGNLLATAFHPELTADTRWHSYFLKMSEDNTGASSSICLSTSEEHLSFYEQPRIDLPVFQY
ncbi:hypothetical protein LguiA_012233 [Lonicera macranthoides]